MTQRSPWWKRTKVSREKSRCSGDLWRFKCTYTRASCKLDPFCVLTRGEMLDLSPPSLSQCVQLLPSPALKSVIWAVHMIQNDLWGSDSRLMGLGIAAHYSFTLKSNDSKLPQCCHKESHPSTRAQHISLREELAWQLWLFCFTGFITVVCMDAHGNNTFNHIHHFHFTFPAWPNVEESPQKLLQSIVRGRQFKV